MTQAAAKERLSKEGKNQLTPPEETPKWVDTIDGTACTLSQRRRNPTTLLTFTFCTKLSFFFCCSFVFGAFFFLSWIQRRDRRPGHCCYVNSSTSNTRVLIAVNFLSHQCQWNVCFFFMSVKRSTQLYNKQLENSVLHCCSIMRVRVYIILRNAAVFFCSWYQYRSTSYVAYNTSTTVQKYVVPGTSATFSCVLHGSMANSCSATYCCFSPRSVLCLRVHSGTQNVLLLWVGWVLCSHQIYFKVWHIIKYEVYEVQTAASRV